MSSRLIAPVLLAGALSLTAGAQIRSSGMEDVSGWTSNLLERGETAISDEQQHVTIVDRLKELSKYKAFQVPPAELESLIITHPAVHDVAVIGVPDDEAGEIPKAFIVTAPGATLGLAELQEFIAGHLAPYKQVRQLQAAAGERGPPHIFLCRHRQPRHQRPRPGGLVPFAAPGPGDAGGQSAWTYPP